MTSKPFYVTTPIYYVNDRPHIGHAYSTVIADVLARFHRMRGRPSRFVTGLDEHGQKIERRATELGQAPQAFVDEIAPPFRNAWQDLTIAHDDFIRTTEPRHKERVQALWRKLVDAGDIYKGHYEDWYCVGCESFKTERELLDGNLCAVHKRPVEQVKEESYFFRLSAYQDRLVEFYEANPQFVQPQGRFNEVLAFVREGLRDLSVTRTSFTWGVPVPDDPAHVIWVWLDALPNCISTLGGPAAPGEAPLFDQYWNDEDSTILHIVGKDILRFHAVYWPAFLMSAGLRLPSQVWAHGWLTVNGEKMSKSLQNFLPPGPLVEAFGSDVVRYSLLRGVSFGHDGDFSFDTLIDTHYNGELGNGLGNLLHRVHPFVTKHFDGKVPSIEADALGPAERELAEVAEKAYGAVAQHWDAVGLNRALEGSLELVAAANRYVNDQKPWVLSKQGDTERLAVVCYAILDVLAGLSVLFSPVLPGKCDELRRQLGLPAIDPAQGQDVWPTRFGALPGGTVMSPGDALFPRIDKKKLLPTLDPALVGNTASTDTATPAKGQKPGKADGNKAGKGDSKQANKSGNVFKAFKKVELRVGRVKTCEAVPDSDKLLRLEVDLGEDAPRQILSGLAKRYEPAELVGKNVVVVANLPPRTIAGLESNGMVLAAGLEAVEVPGDIAPGTEVS